jgi:hypothetical protein
MCSAIFRRSKPVKLGPLVEGQVKGTIQERFEEFHRLNPWVCTALEFLAEDLISRGRKRIGIRMLWEVLRWEYQRQTIDPNSDFKANDHYHSRYVRLLIERNPEWSSAFELRTLRAA